MVAAKMTVYTEEDDQYFTFISREAFRTVDDWIKYREEPREMISNESWVMRDLWDARQAQGLGLVTKPKKLSSLGVKRLTERAIWATGFKKKFRTWTYQANYSLRKSRPTV